MIIRQEEKKDFEEIYKLVKKAFETAEIKDGHEQDLVNELRESSKYISELALVAEENSRIVGYIMITKTKVVKENDSFEVRYMAPVAVDIEFRKQNIGSSLNNTAKKIAYDMDFKAIFLAGNPAFYNRFGFVPTKNFGIKCNIDISEEFSDNIMACELYENALNRISGTVQF